MTAYVIAEVDVHDLEEYARYRSMVPDTLAAFGGRFVVRGGTVVALEGDWQPSRIVVLEFSSLETAEAWHASDEYREARTLRQRTTHSRLIAVDGVD